MKNIFTIYINRLSNGSEAKVCGKYPSDFLDINEAYLQFDPFIHFDAKAYIASDNLILQFNAKAIALIPCSICNEITNVEIIVKNFYHTEYLQNINNGIFDFGENLIEAILLEIPQFAECNKGNCLEKNHIDKYISNHF